MLTTYVLDAILFYVYRMCWCTSTRNVMQTNQEHGYFWVSVVLPIQSTPYST